MNSKQKPQVIAMDFMSDLFHKKHDTMAICRVLDKTVKCKQHTFILLTKRPDRMLSILGRKGPSIPNLIGGVSIWDQPSADRMIPILLQANLATRIVSLEPCLGAVDFEDIDGNDVLSAHSDSFWGGLDALRPTTLDGVILGGESGPGARPIHPDWARSVRDQCQAAGVPFFFKQWGEYLDIDIAIKRKFLTTYEGTSKYQPYTRIDGYELPFVKVGKKAAGRLLDGRTWDELPEVMTHG